MHAWENAAAGDVRRDCGRRYRRRSGRRTPFIGRGNRPLEQNNYAKTRSMDIYPTPKSPGQKSHTHPRHYPADFSSAGVVTLSTKGQTTLATVHARSNGGVALAEAIKMRFANAIPQPRLDASDLLPRLRTCTYILVRSG